MKFWEVHQQSKYILRRQSAINNCMIIWLWFKEIMVIFWNKKIWLVAGCWWRCLTKKNIKIQDSPNGILNKRTAEYVVFPASTNTNFETLFMYWICSFWVSTSQFDKGIHRCNCEREVKKNCPTTTHPCKKKCFTSNRTKENAGSVSCASNIKLIFPAQCSYTNLCVWCMHMHIWYIHTCMCIYIYIYHNMYIYIYYKI